MSVPAVPTVNSILTEAFRRCGIPSPTPAQLLRAEDEWLEEVKQELDAEKRWHNLEDTQIIIPVAYQQDYSIPSPLYRVLRMRFYDGGKKSTAQAGGATSITIASGAGDDNDLGKKIFITGGTGSAQVNRIISRSGDVYTVQNTWATNPSAGSTYMIADIEQVMNDPEVNIRRLGTGTTNLIQRWEEFEGTLIVWPIPNASTFALEVDGIVDISLVDETDARLTRVLREWRGVLIAGVMVRIKEEQGDDDLPYYANRYEQLALKFKIKDARKRRPLTPAVMRGPGGLPRRRWY